MCEIEKFYPPEQQSFDIGVLLRYCVNQEDIQVYESIFKQKVNEGVSSTDAKFRYAWALVHSTEISDVKKALPLLEELFKKGDEQTKRDTLFYLAVAEAKLKDYRLATKYVKAFLSVEPNNAQAQQLSCYIEENMKKDGIKGLAIIGGAAVLGGAAVVAFGGLMLAAGLGLAISSIGKKK